MTSGTRRQLAHAAMGLSALALRWTGSPGAVAIAGLAVAHNRWILPRMAPDLWRPGERARGEGGGIQVYPWCLLGAALVFWGRPALCAATWGLLAFGDAAAAFAGLRIGGRPLPWNPAKTWAGLLAFLACGTLGAAALYRFVAAGRTPAALGALALAGAGAVAAAFAESAPEGLDDNVRVTAVGAAALALAAAMDPAVLAAAGPALAERLPIALGAAAGLAALAVAARAADVPGAVAGGILTAWLGTVAGLAGVVPLAAFVVLGSLATRAGAARKAALGTAQERGGRRSARHALANGLVGAAVAVLVVGTGRPSLGRLAIAGAFATAAFDTVATEIGQAFGGAPRRLASGGPATARALPPGTVGGVTAVGTVAGLAAAFLVAVAAAGAGPLPDGGVPVVVGAALVGSTVESLAAPRLAGRGLLGPGARNLLNTAVGAGLCLALGARSGG